jgi:hypothetical protein
LNNALKNNGYELKVYNQLGMIVENSILTTQETRLNTANLSSGIYFYNVTDNGKVVQSGKLISQQ